MDTININEGKYLYRLNKTLKNEEKQSFTDILKSYGVISADYYNKFANNKRGDFQYSSYNFNDCPGEERVQFAREQLATLRVLVTNNIKQLTGNVVDWWYVYALLYNAEYSKVEKTKRKVVFSTEGTDRPIGEKAYLAWNGLQIIDLDIKDADIAEKLKYILFDELKKENWFLGICKSSSGKGLHVWTKIRPMTLEFAQRKIEYLCNFRQKYSYVYIYLRKHAAQLGYTKEDILKYMDMAMAKPQQGIFISSDMALMNMNFIDERLDFNFETAFDNGIESVNWIIQPDLKEIFQKLEWFNDENFNKETDVEKENIEYDFEDVDYKTSGPKHYKHAQRWQLANTLTNMYGEQKALEIMCNITQGTDRRELSSIIHTASIYHKPISIWAVNELNKRHGFKIKIKGSDTFKEEIQKLDDEISSIKDTAIDPTKILNDRTVSVNLHLNNNQYLSDIKDDIMANLSQITLLEAGAGYGKTEMIKALKAKTMLILPFTSTIKAKIEASDVTKDWLYFYGNKKPTLDDLMQPCSMSMTIDKFSHINIFEINAAGFEYVVIDESHLLFTSSYRSVMSPCIQHIANLKAKVILMTGTPTGEKLFFPNIKHIKVVKDDNRVKEFNCIMSPTMYEQKFNICQSIAEDIIAGKKILYPTDQGNLFVEEMTGIIQQDLINLGYTKPLRFFYYKKSNIGDDSMENININKSVGENDIIFCTTYLSVGVDICDRLAFCVYFSETKMPQDIEQFANRLRNNDLYLKMFLPKKINDIPVNYYTKNPLNLEDNEEDIVTMRNMITSCNYDIARNSDDWKYNPVTSALINGNKCISYDENDTKYYIDITMYKLMKFEKRYKDYLVQLPVMMESLRYYGYTTNITDLSDEISDAKKAELDEYIKGCRMKRWDYQTQQTFNLLGHISDSNIEHYRELLKGNYSVFRDKDKAAEREQYALYTESIEILEKNLPIILSLYKYYECSTIVDIYKFCTDPKHKKLNFAKVERIREFANIDNARRKKRLDFPVHKFVVEAHEYARTNPVVTQHDINMFIATFTSNYINSIPDLVVNGDNNMYFEEMFSLMKKLWAVCIVQSRPKQNKISIEPFELTWERKDILQTLYGDQNTREFFLDTLIDDAAEKEKKEQERQEELKYVAPDFEKTTKLMVEDIKDEIPTLIPKDFDYSVYSDIDKSNERFIRKQENTDRSKDALNRQEGLNKLNEDLQKIDNEEHDLFDGTN